MSPIQSILVKIRLGTPTLDDVPAIELSTSPILSHLLKTFDLQEAWFTYHKVRSASLEAGWGAADAFHAIASQME